MANELGEPQAELVLADHTVPPAPAPPILTEFSPPVPPPPIVRHDVSARTVAKAVLVAALTLGGLWVLVKLADVVLMLFIALLLTAALDPLVGRLARRAWPRPLSVTGIVLVALGLVALLLRLLVPPLVAQGSAFLDHLPTYTAQLHDLLAYNPQLQARLTAAAKGGAGSSGGLATGLLRVGSGLVTGTSDLVIVLVMTVYLLVDGDRTYAWITHYLPTGQRRKVRRALPEVSRVVSGYVLGQAITSLLFGVLAYVLLWVVGVPQPLLLAVVAALVDAIPVAGVLLATVPAVLAALTVSPGAALIVVIGYLGYHQVESHVLVPRIYAGRLRISSFAVLVAVLIGWTLLGIIGVLLALPIAAAIPAIEQIWREPPTTPSPALAAHPPEDRVTE